MPHPLRILLIDDDYQDYVITRDLFEELRIKTELEWVSSYEAALEKFANASYDVYLIDFRLGQHTGFDILNALVEQGSRVPAIMLTGTAGHGIDEDAMKAGAVDYLVKGQLTSDSLERALRYARARKEYENKLRVSEEQLRLSLDAAQMAAWDWNMITDSFSASERLYEFLGLPTDSKPLEINDLESYIHPDDLPTVMQKLRQAIEDGSEFEQEFRIIDTLGHSKWLFNKGRIERSIGDVPIRIYGGSTDVTARREAEEAVKHADRMKDEFLAMLSHELRNPLSAIANAVTVSGISPNLETLLWSRELIERQSMHLKRLLDDLLDLSRVNRSNIQLRREVLDVTECVRQAISATEMIFREQEQVIRTIFSEQPLHVYADPTRLEQAVVNLLVNASKYTERGGSIRLTTSRDGDSVQIKIADTGIGLPAEQLEKIFELFSQVDRSLDRSQGGLGIGLTLVRGIAEMHEGTVHARSEGIGTGSEFVLTLPEVSAPTIEHVAVVEVPAPTRGTTKRIVVVDDNRDNADTISKLLRMMGFEVETAYEGETALSMIRSAMPDVVLLDIGLPGMDGFQVAEELRRDSGFADLCLIALSGYGRPEDKERSKAAGFDYHLVKPVDFDELTRVLGDEGACEP